MTSHDDYLADCEPAARARLEAIRTEAERRVPDAKRCISYKMPALKQERVFFYFAAFKNHIGVYPPVSGPPELVEELVPYRGPKGNLIFPHKADLPLDLIGRAAEALAAAYGSGASRA